MNNEKIMKALASAVAAAFVLGSGSAFAQGRSDVAPIQQKQIVEKHPRHDARDAGRHGDRGRYGHDDRGRTGRHDDRRDHADRRGHVYAPAHRPGHVHVPAHVHRPAVTHVHVHRGAGPRRDLHRGTRLPSHYHHSRYYVNDWRAHRLSPPPHGHRWVQVDGDYVLVAVATGIIAHLLLAH